MVGDAHELELYRKVLLVRRSEERIQQHYLEDEMKTPVHLYIGQEAVAVGVCAALEATDPVVGTYRSHGIYLARTEDVEGFFGELYGRVTGPGKGKAGSMHLASPEHGVVMTSAVVGTTIPVALGLAWAKHYRREPGVAAAFFGDGAVDEGVFWESLNFACLKRLPVLFICEDNGLAIHTRAEDRHGYRDIARVVSAFDCHVASSDSADPLEICDLTRDLLRAREADGRPAFLHLQCYRFVEHVGIRVDRDFHLGYRREEEFADWTARDPVRVLRERLVAKGVPEEQLKALEEEIDARLARAIESARTAPRPDPKSLYEDVWA